MLTLSASTVSAVGAFSFVELIAYGLVADRLLSNEKLFPRANCVGFYPHQRPRWPEGRLASQKPRSFLAGGKVWLHTKTGQPWAHHQQLRRSLWEPLLKRAGVLYRRPYNIRHTYASALLTQGQNPWYVGQQLGHNDVECVYRVYGKFIRQDYLKPRLVAVQT